MASFTRVTSAPTRMLHARRSRSLPRRVFLGGVLTVVSFTLLAAVWGWA